MTLRGALDRGSLAGFMALGAAGFASAAALLLLASNRIPGLGAAQVTPMLLAIQWNLVGVTLAKFGVDYALFAILSRHRDATFHLRSSLAFPVLPALAAFTAASLFLFTPVQAALLALAVLADALSTFRQAEFNAKRAFGAAALGMGLNYPLFVLTWALVAQGRETSLTEGLAAFAFSSLARWTWLSLRYAAIARGARPVQLNVKGLIGAQGALNLALFRMDQVMLAVLLFLGARALAQDPALPAYVFLARIPEFATGVLVMAGTVWFPLKHLQPGGAPGVLRFYGAAALLAGIGGSVATAILLPAFAGSRPSVAWCAPFVLQIPLILLANLATYSMQSQGYLPGQIRNLSMACAVGLGIAALALWNGSLQLLAWAVPAQVAVFFALAVGAGWGGKLAMFEDARAE